MERHRLRSFAIVALTLLAGCALQRTPSVVMAPPTESGPNDAASAGALGQNAFFQHAQRWMSVTRWAPVS